jgi:hypothetical protein
VVCLFDVQGRFIPVVGTFTAVLWYLNILFQSGCGINAYPADHFLFVVHEVSYLRGKSKHTSPQR